QAVHSTHLHAIPTRRSTDLSGSWIQGTGNEAPMTASKPLWIGSIQSGGVNVNFWNGDLDDVRVYNRALSASEIAALVTGVPWDRSEEHTSELQSRSEFVC